MFGSTQTEVYLESAQGNHTSTSANTNTTNTTSNATNTTNTTNITNTNTDQIII